MTQQPSDRIKESLNIWDVAEAIDCPIPRNVSGRPPCPFCQSKSGFAVREGTYFHCYKCANKGSVIDLAMLWLDCDFSEAVRRLLPLASLTVKPINHNPDKLERIFEWYEKAFRHSREAQEYAKERGWPEVPMGFAPDDTYLRKHAGFGAKELSSLGLITRSRKEYFDRRIIFPIRNAEGRIVHLQGRSLNPNNEIKWLSTSGEPSINDFLYNGEKLQQSYQAYDYLFFTEGISDALSLEAMGLPAVAMLGNRMPLRDYRKSLEQYQAVCFCLDNDKYELGTPEEGRYKSWSVMMPEIIHLQNIIDTPVYCLMPPNISGVTDINEFVQRLDGDRDKFWEFLEKHVFSVDRMALTVFDGTSKEDLYWLVRALKVPYSSDQTRQTVKGRIEYAYYDWMEFLKDVV